VLTELSLVVVLLGAAEDAPFTREETGASLVALLPSTKVGLSQDERFQRQVQLLRVEGRIATFDTSGPAWSSYVRGAGYVLLPFGLLMAPYLSGGNSPVSMVVPSTYRTAALATTELQTVHTTGWWLLGGSIALLTVGIISGVTGWVLKKLELGRLESERDALQAELSASGPGLQAPALGVPP